jgi:transmembrane sensor
MEERIPENLIVRYLSNEASSEEQLQLFEWISQDNLHQKLFNEYCDLWSKSYKPSFKFDLQQGLHRLHARLEEEEFAPKKKPFAGWLKIAASVSILFVASLAVYFLGKYTESASVIDYAERINAAGEKTTIQLSDGSIVLLNTNSTLRFPKTFKGMKREVFLEGEAFFEVEKDSLHPFIVHTNTVSTQVLGTTFNVNSTTISVAVSVATGKVRVIEGNTTELLLPQQKITYLFVEKNWNREETNLEQELAWKNNTLIIEEKNLAEAAAILENWYGAKISFANAALKNCRITGKYKNESLENVLRAISYSSEIQFELNNKEVTLFGKGCE